MRPADGAPALLLLGDEDGVGPAAPAAPPQVTGGASPPSPTPRDRPHAARMTHPQLPVVNAAGQACCQPLTVAPVPGPLVDALANAFKAIGDPVRLRLLSMIASHPAREVCVYDLAAAFDLSGPTISYHLRVLRDVGLIQPQRRGTWIYYRAVPGRLAAMAQLLGVPVPPPAA